MIAASTAVAAERNVPLLRHGSISGNFKDWLGSSAYQVSQTANVISVVPNDKSASLTALSNDLIRLARAGRETLENVSANRTADSVHPAWSAIQLYYAAFYYASAMLRTVGRSSNYFLTHELSGIRNHLQIQFASNLPSKGIYSMTLSADGQAMSLEKDSLSGSHEALWKLYREYLTGLKNRLGSYGQFEQSVVIQALDEIDYAIDCSTGLANDNNLSSARNEIQYRQGLSCWHPNARKVRQFHETDRISQTLADGFEVASTISTSSDYAEFFTRCLVICGIAHSTFRFLAECETGNVISNSYMRYHHSLSR